MIPTPPPPSKEHTPRCGPPEPQVQDNNFLVALLEYEKHKIETGEFQVASSALPDRFGSESQVDDYSMVSFIPLDLRKESR
ncbi:hypothetical protein Zm00014a_040026 [Zea mays]|uniref:Uncharacterized protein n=1 Tax=Zea mays TaxID=4577 RepID=A0A3L6DKM8_MAIZE|nr:hypothetical protein Zm00014a_040026 [Zea mays]